MYRCRFVLESFEHLSPIQRMAVIGHMVEALVFCNLAFIRAVPTVPLLYQAGVRYQQEPDGEDDWRDIPDVLRDHEGDCEDLAAWRVAELQFQGEPARPRVLWFENFPAPGLSDYHIVVARADGRTEDPSRILGMP